MPASDSTIASPTQSRSQQQLLTTWQGANVGALNHQDLVLLTILKQSQGAVEAIGCMSTALKVLQLQLRSYDLLLSDLGLPEIDSWALTTTSSGNVPAIALAGHRIERDRNPAWLLGFQMLLSKPIEPTQLLIDMIKPIGKTLPS
jgi:CheY-like chemotaxis protein